MAYKTIVLATDGSPTAEIAERVAAGLAAAVKSRLTIATAAESPERVETAVARAREIADGQGLRHDVVSSAEAPEHAIVEIADQREADLIVMGSRGLFKAEQVIGNVARKVSTRAPCDVLLTRPRPDAGAPNGAPYRHMLIATDGSVTADRAARKGYALAKRIAAKVTLVFVGHPKTGELVLADTVATSGAESGVDSATVVRRGDDPADEIIAAAVEQGADLVVVGNRGLAGAKAAILGSVPKKVSEFAPMDVLVARTVTQNLEEIGKGEGGIVSSGDHKVAVYRDRKGEIVTLSARCTHMGCTVKWNPAESTWDCPCHGSRYAPTGEVVNGPAEKPLAPTQL
jgi:nucleotide-binding universal stress UspA family protein/nitrite reductase/ring-hydroxylating ferredoxin subunit